MSEWDHKTHLATGILKNIEKGKIWGIKHLENRQRFPNLVTAKNLDTKPDE